jgi:hypothetical protein
MRQFQVKPQMIDVLPTKTGFQYTLCAQWAAVYLYKSRIHNYIKNLLFKNVTD